MLHLELQGKSSYRSMMNPPTIDVLRAATMEGIVDVRTKWSWKCEMIIIVYALHKPQSLGRSRPTPRPQRRPQGQR